MQKKYNLYNIEESENPLVQSCNRKRHLCEVGLLLFLTLFFWGLFALSGSLRLIWTFLCLALTALLFFRAMHFSKQALQAYRSVQFKITDRRLRTLKAMDVKEDVLNYLEEIHGKTFKGEARFFRMLQRALGSERAREVRSTIFKYTRV